jgi:uncharacterized protein (TIGR04255 family)
MGKPLKSPPVYFTIVQVRFNTVLKLSEYLPSIQEGLRRAGFPAFTQRSSIVLQFTIQDGQTVPQRQSQEQYIFANIGQTHSFVLTSETLAFQSTDYGTYESFSEMFLKGLQLVHDQVSLAFTERVGLRYLDHVLPRSNEEVERYLAPEVQGLSARLGGQPIQSFAEMVNDVGDVRLRVRVLVRSGRLAFPPDLVPDNMAVQTRFAAANGKHAILDTDGFVEERELFSLETVKNHLNTIHTVISASFRATVTPHALKVWDE